MFLKYLLHKYLNLKQCIIFCNSRKYTDDDKQPISFKASASSNPTQNAVLLTRQAISGPEDVLKPGVFACSANSIMPSPDEVDAYDSPKAISGETETERCKLLQQIRTGTSLKVKLTFLDLLGSKRVS